MRVLIIKTSSMGDLIHALPAITDAAKNYPDIEFDWVAEKSFAEIPTWHPNVKKVIPVSWRKWRKSLWKKQTQDEMKAFFSELRREKYDFVVDLQGLLKSAVLAAAADGVSCGLNFSSARDHLAALLYQKKYPVEFKQHAILRARLLLSQALNYSFDAKKIDYGISRPGREIKGQVLFIHGTSRVDKEWAEENWVGLAKWVEGRNYEVLLPWGSEAEKLRAERIALKTRAKVLPRMSLSELKNLLAECQFAVAVDTGLGHLGAALNVPCVSLYPATDPALIGAQGENQIYCLADGDGKIAVNSVSEQLLNFAKN